MRIHTSTRSHEMFVAAVSNDPEAVFRDIDVEDGTEYASSRIMAHTSGMENSSQQHRRWFHLKEAQDVQRLIDEHHPEWLLKYAEESCCPCLPEWSGWRHLARSRRADIHHVGGSVAYSVWWHSCLSTSRCRHRTTEYGDVSGKSHRNHETGIMVSIWRYCVADNCVHQYIL